MNEDLARAGLSWPTAILRLVHLHPVWAVLGYRLARWLFTHHVPVAPTLIHGWVRTVFGADLSPGASIGPGLALPHPVGVVVGWGVEAGANLLLYQGVTIGFDGRSAEGRAAPKIGNDVTVCVNAVVTGPVTVGDRAMIGALSVVRHDVAHQEKVMGVH